MVNIDLKASGVERSAYENRTDSSLLIIFLSLIITLAIAGGMYFWKISLDKNIKSLDSQITAENEKLSRQDTKDIMDLQNRLGVAKTIIEKDNKLLASLSELEKTVVSGVYIKSFSYKNDIAEALLVADDFPSLARQIDSFKNSDSIFKKVESGPAKLNSSQKVEANITLAIN